MGGTIGPAPRGLNAKLLDSERKLKAFLARIMGGEDDTIPISRQDSLNDDVRLKNRMITSTRSEAANKMFRRRLLESSPKSQTPNFSDVMGGGSSNADYYNSPEYQEQIAAEDDYMSDPDPSEFSGPMQLYKDPMIRDSRPPMPRRNPIAPMGPQRDLSALIKPEVSMGSPDPQLMDMGKQRDMSALLGPPPGEPAPFEMPPPQAMIQQPEDEDAIMIPPTRPEARTEEYLGHLRNRPRYEDHKSSTGRKIGAGILGMLLGTDFGIGKAPYNRALRKWSDEGSGLKEGADIEQKRLIEGRRSLKDTMRHDIALKRYQLDVKKAKDAYDTKMKEITSREKMGADRNEIERERHEETQRYHKELLLFRREMMNKVSIPRVQSYGQSVNQRGNLSGRQQKDYLDLAYRETGADPRFEKWYDPASNKFRNAVPRNPLKPNQDLETISPETKELIQREILRRQQAIANRTKESYGDELWGENPFDYSDEEGME